MTYSKPEIELLIKEWLNKWNEHNLEEVMNFIHKDIVFENWTGAKIQGKNLLKKAWTPWFRNHGNFKFTDEDIFFDEKDQKLVLMWELEWPSQPGHFTGKTEIRRGVDIVYFLEKKIFRKYSYTKTTVLIDGHPISL